MPRGAEDADPSLRFPWASLLRAQEEGSWVLGAGSALSVTLHPFDNIGQNQRAAGACSGIKDLRRTRFETVLWLSSVHPCEVKGKSVAWMATQSHQQ